MSRRPERQGTDPDWEEVLPGELMIKVMYRETDGSGWSGYQTIPEWRQRLRLNDLDNPEWMDVLLLELLQAAYNWRK